MFFEFAPLTSTSAASSIDAGSVFWVAGLGVVSTILIVGGIVLYGFMMRALERRQSFRMAILRVTLPKDSASDQPQEMNQDKLREHIAVAETLMATLVSLTKPPHWWTVNKPFSFEIVAHQKLISFYVSVPLSVVEVVMQHIHAQYDEAQVEIVPDYNVFQARSVVAGAYLKAKREAFFPFKTYQTLDSDPLNAITNVLSRLDEHEGAVVQMVFTAASRTWRRKGKLLIRQMQKGTHMAEAVRLSQRSIFLRVIFEIGAFFRNIASSQGKDSKSSNEPDRLSPKEEEVVKLIEEKISKTGIATTIRLVVSASSEARAQSQLESMMSAFSQYTIFEYGNAFRLKKPFRLDMFIHDFIYRTYHASQSVVLNSEEFSSIYHFPLPFTETPNIRWLAAKKAGPPVDIPTEGVILGESDFRGLKKTIRILEDDRRRHMYVIGRSGVGKTVFMTQMVIQDIANGKGVGVIDPHGEFVEDILERIPPERAEDVVYFNPSDVERPMGLNLMEFDARYPEQKTFVINEMIKIFDKLYDLKTTGGPMFEQYMRNAMLLVMEDPESGSTLMEIPKVLADKAFRTYKLSHCANPVVRDFWTKEAEKAGGEASLQNMVPYITSKLTQFVANDMMRPIIAQQQSAFNLRDLMDQKKIFLVNLSKGRLGDINAYLIGMIMVSKILMAALSRTDIPQNQRHDFYLYIDEFQNFITDSIATILSEARKYRLDLIIAHQYMGQLVEHQETKIRDAVLGNAGTIVTFRIGIDDAEILEKEFAPTFNKFDLINIEAYHAYIKLLIRNQASRPFTLKSIPLGGGNRELAEHMRQLSRLKYGRDRRVVEQEILERVHRTEEPVKAPEEETVSWKL